MRSFMIAAALLVLVNAPSAAQIQRFPYDAVVEVDGAYVRSGPRKTFNPTSRLAKGQKVRVKRHDPGGWYAIVPPAGSFSWIPKEYVRKTGRGTGEVLENKVIVYIGTAFGIEATAFTKSMSIGDQVTILGEAEVQTALSKTAMYKIKPPRLESRYVRGHVLVPASESMRNAQDRDPFSTPSTARRQPARKEPAEKVAAKNPTTSRPRTRLSGSRSFQVDPERMKADRQRLDQLDETFKAIIRQPTSQWDFAQLEADYRRLQQTAAHPAIASQINLRFPALERYKRTKNTYDDFVSLTRETSARDASLLRGQSGLSQMAPPVGTLGPPRRTSVAPTRGVAPNSLIIEDSIPANLPEGTRRVKQRHPRFAGAGIVQRSNEPSIPGFVLLSPRGKILAYLAGPGVERAIGYTIGVEGDRYFRPDLKADYIVARKLFRVTLLDE